MLWVCSLRDASLSQSEGSALRTRALSSLPAEEQRRIAAFLFAEDRDRALLSALLQRALARETFPGLRDAEIRRTKHNKPYLHAPQANTGCWNYNVSHHGDFVGIASHHHALVGLDIVDISSRNALAPTCASLCEMFTSHLTENEITHVLSAESEDERFSLFYLYWSLKESFVKAHGQGLLLDLLSIEFSLALSPSHAGTGTETRYLSGTATVSFREHTLSHTSSHALSHTHAHTPSEWAFRFFSLDARHVLSLALGPLQSCDREFAEKAFAHTIIDTHSHLHPHINVAGEAERLVSQVRFVDFAWLCDTVLSEA